ncbi:MAG: putative isomerase, partial [Ancylomarina sp.]
MHKMTSKNITRLFLSILVLASCQPKTNKQVDLQEEMANVLNIRGIPQAQYELEPFGFSDMGAWHGYALPDIDSTAYYGGFSGPLCMKMWGQWVSKNLSQLELTDASSMTTIDLSKATAEVNYKPGKLEQTLELEHLSLKLSLIFVSDRTALIQTNIKNKSKEQLSLFVGWKGELFPKGISLSESKKGLRIDYKDGEEFFLVQNDSDKSLQISPNKHSYQMFMKDKQEISSGETLEVNLLHSYYFNQREADKEADLYTNWLDRTDLLFADNKSRWNGYLNKALDSNNPLLDKEEYR